MNLFSLLAQRAPNKVFFSLVVGILSGVVYSLLIPIIMASLDSAAGLEDGAPPTVVLGFLVSDAPTALLFGGALLFVWASRTWVDVTMAKVSGEVASQLRTRMYDRIAHAPLAAIEKIGLPRLVTAMANDMPAIVAGSQMTQTMLIDTVTLIGMLGFLAYLHLGVFWFVLKCVVFGVLSYQMIFLYANRHFIRAAQLHDTMHQAVHGLMHGFKELKLSDEKRRAYFESVLLATEGRLLAAQHAGNMVHSSAANYGLMLNFLFIGSIAFLFVNYQALSPQTLASVMMVMLYISMPIGSLTSKIPGLALAGIAIRRINVLFDELPLETVALAPGRALPWRRVRFAGVHYAHGGQGDGPGFSVGPLDLQILKGEITFIVGGNGSGKSTLSKLLTLHYHATGGAIYFDDERLTGDNMNTFRQSISAIYSDYYLFDRILTASPDQKQIEHYLKQLGLDGKVRYVDGRFSTLSLSDGQRRRMALVAAFMEDRDLYLFDEWAADQDPAFKDVFYREILPSLKTRGKAVVVISHDDRYFDVADNLIVMCEGKIQAAIESVTVAS